MEIEQFVQYIKRSKTGYVDSGSQDLKVRSNSWGTELIIYTIEKCHKCNRDDPKEIMVSFFKSQSLTVFEAGMLFYLFSHNKKVTDYGEYHKCQAGIEFINNIKQIEKII